MHDMSFDVQWAEFMAGNRRDIETNPQAFLRYAKLMYFWQYKFWFLDLLNYTGEILMTRGKKSTAATTQRKSGALFTEFVNISLSESDAEKVTAYAANSDEVFRAFEDLCVAGYRVGFSYDAQRDALICSLTCKAQGAPNEGKTMTSFAGDWYTALAVSLYKHYVLTNEVWSSDTKANRPAFG